jgi:hypothetical protein
MGLSPIDHGARQVRKRGPKRLLRDEILAIFLDGGLPKNIATDHHVSTGMVYFIKNGKRHADVTGPWLAAAPLNGTLISLACTGAP